MQPAGVMPRGTTPALLHERSCAACRTTGGPPIVLWGLPPYSVRGLGERVNDRVFASVGLDSDRLDGGK